MDHQSYQQIYFHYQESVTQTMLFADLAIQVFEDFPNKVPKEIAQPLIDEVNETVNMIRRLQDGELPPPMELDPSFSSAVTARLAMSSLSFTSPISTDFSRLLCLQVLVMIIAHLDAFIGDSFRTIYQVCPQALKSGDKKVDVDTIISCGTWDNLIDLLIERDLFRLGMESLTDRMERLGNLGLVKSHLESYIPRLEQAAEIRHIIVHNGGKVNQKYIDKTKQPNLTIGEPVPITYEYVREVSLHSQILVAGIYGSISRKFFDVET